MGTGGREAGGLGVLRRQTGTAFRLNLIYGKNTSVEMLDIGFFNQTTTMSNGLQWGTVSYNEGGLSGLQLGAINYTKGNASGLQ